MKSKILLLILLLFLSFETFGLPTAEKGTIDLSGITYNEMGIIKLDGEWKVVENQLLTPNMIENDVSKTFVKIPHKWKQSGIYASYILNINGLEKGKLYTVKTRDMGVAYNL